MQRNIDDKQWKFVSYFQRRVLNVIIIYLSPLKKLDALFINNLQYIDDRQKLFSLLPKRLARKMRLCWSTHAKASRKLQHFWRKHAACNLFASNDNEYISREWTQVKVLLTCYKSIFPTDSQVIWFESVVDDWSWSVDFSVTDNAFLSEKKNPWNQNKKKFYRKWKKTEKLHKHIEIRMLQIKVLTKP